jgi:fructose-1,6-bisphosphatase/inositol monophosphatase family enzyme
MSHHESSRPPLPLDWLDPTLDRCRLAIERGVDRSWQKTSSGTGTATVTNLDLEVEDTLVAAIQDRFPEAKVVSEERHPETSALTAPMCFVIDPIDGTEELVAGRSGFSISIALFHGGQPHAAVLDFPARGNQFTCGAGLGAWLAESPIRLRQSAALADARIVVSATQRRSPELLSVWSRLKVAETIPVPAFTPKFAALLLGDCDAAVHLPVDKRTTFVWDYAAAAMLLLEAGGLFTSWSNRDLLSELPHQYTGGWLASSTRDLHRGLRASLQQLLEAHSC